MKGSSETRLMSPLLYQLSYTATGRKPKGEEIIPDRRSECLQGCEWSSLGSQENPWLARSGRIPYTPDMMILLPATCEAALLERFLKAEAMALWSVRAAQARDVPEGVLGFLRKHEEDEAEHLKEFEARLGVVSHRRERLPRVPSQWYALVIHLYGYEALGLEFAKLLVQVQPDLRSILEDEEVHVGFFEQEVRKVLAQGGVAAAKAKESAASWWRKLPPTVDRYVDGESLSPYRVELKQAILTSVGHRFHTVGLLPERVLLGAI